MRLTSDSLKLDLQLTENRIKRYIRDYVTDCKAKGTVVGLSGGVGSSTMAALVSLALGGDRMMAIFMPENETCNPMDRRHASMIAERFGFKIVNIDITPILQAYYEAIPTFDEEDIISKGNIKARSRMICLYYYANHLSRIVIGSSDKSETMMGYFTKWGDVAADISPIMDLYKTQVRMLAEHIGIPEEIVDKPSTPQLWPGQVAEEELGIRYESLDLILLGLENFLTPEDIAQQLSLPKKLVIDIKKRWLSNEHKRRGALSLKIGYRTVGKDFRIPYTIH